jgi:hypothetical protein
MAKTILHHSIIQKSICTEPAIAVELRAAADWRKLNVDFQSVADLATSLRWRRLVAGFCLSQS